MFLRIGIVMGMVLTRGLAFGGTAIVQTTSTPKNLSQNAQGPQAVWGAVPCTTHRTAALLQEFFQFAPRAMRTAAFRAKIGWWPAALTRFERPT
jgi:hypothetical protein